MWLRDDAKLLKYNSKGLIPAVIQDAETQRVLMFVYLNKDAIKKSKKTGDLWLYHRAKRKIWKKGSHSGNTMKVTEIYVHHDRHVLLIQVIPTGPACHLGNESCFVHSFLRDGLREEFSMEEDEEEGEALQALRRLFESEGLADKVEVQAASRDRDGIRKGLENETEEAKSSNTQEEKDDDFWGKLFEDAHREWKQRKQLLPADNGFSQKTAQRIGEQAIRLLSAVAQKNQNEVLSLEADIFHELILLFIDQQLEIGALKEELKRLVL